MNDFYFKTIKYASILTLCAVSIYTSFLYQGSLLIYILFTISFNSLLFLGLKKSNLFFDTFISIYLWLGFWFKLSSVLIFSDSKFNDSGDFVYSPTTFDKCLIASSIGAIAYICVILVRRKFFIYKKDLPNKHLGFLLFFNKYRTTIFYLFFAAVIFISFSNAFLGIYQKGTPTQIVLPFGINNLYKWLLLFGFTSFSAFFLSFEFKNSKSPFAFTFLAIMECFLSSVSQLSRAMIINLASLAIGTKRFLNLNNIKVSYILKIHVLLISIFFFVLSIFSVNTIRTYRFSESSALEIMPSAILKNTTALFTDRFIGIEAVMAVSNYPGQGWNFFNKAWEEKFSEVGTSFYDIHVIQSPYIKSDLSKNHFISLPGIIAFMFYPGSFVFLFIFTFSSGCLASLIEVIAFKALGSLIFCSIVGQVVAYRFIHFGYAPAQTHLLFVTILFNISVFFIFNKICSLLLMVDNE